MRYSMIPLHAILTLLLIASPSINSAHGDLYTDPAYSSLFPERTVYSMGTIPQNYTMTQVSFEVELGWVDDIPSLDNESDIVVLGNVQETPRYGVGGEAWVDGEWMNYDFDTTLSDRFVVNCTQDKAINMSSYTWVEWTAPIEDGTTYGETQPPEQELGIIFEYGAESGVVQPPWDVAGAHGGASDGSGYAQTSTTHERTGTQSVKLYQPPPYKLEGDRRIVLREYIGTHEKDIYWSWWAYFPDIPVWNDADYWHTLGGIRWCINVGGTADFSGIALQIHQYGFLQIFYSNYFDPNDDATVQLTNWKVYDHLNEWVHFQFHLKLTSDSSGVAQVWINNSLEMDLSGLQTDPESFAAWGAGGYYYAGGSPFVGTYLYSEKNSLEAYYYADDFVAAREKVPETYRVNE